MPQNRQQNGVFEDVGVVSGVEGVAVTEHGWMVNRPPLYWRNWIVGWFVRPRSKSCTFLVYWLTAALFAWAWLLCLPTSFQFHILEF